MRSQLRSSLVMAAVAACAAVAMVSAQTKITAPKNKFPPQVDVEEGRKGAAAIEKQMPVFPDEVVTAYIRGVGGRLVAQIPPEFQHPEFQYVFKVVDVKDINAFALPGGPMYVHRGIMEASQTEGEMAGVMAHEIVHVALRHGTAQVTASESSRFKFGALAGAIAGTVVGGDLGNAIAAASNFGMNTAFLRFSRDYEKQADLLGVQMMARAGYDPRDLAHMFETIQKEGGGRDPQWMSDHPNPGNRVAYINEEASHVTIAPPPPDPTPQTVSAAPVPAPSPAPSAAASAPGSFPIIAPTLTAPPEGVIVPASRAGAASGRMSFAGIQQRLKTFPPAPTMQELAQRAQQQQRGR